MFEVRTRPAKEYALVLLNQAPPLPAKTMQKALEQCFTNLTGVLDPALQAQVTAYINQSWNMLCCVKSNWSLYTGGGQPASAWTQMSPGRLKSLTEAALQVPPVLHELSNWFPFVTIDGDRSLVFGTPLQRDALQELVLNHRNDFMQLATFLKIPRTEISTDGNVQEEGKLAWRHGMPQVIGEAIVFPEEAQRLFFIREAARQIGQNQFGQEHPFNRHQDFEAYTIGQTEYVGFGPATNDVQFQECSVEYEQTIVVLDNSQNWYDSINPDTYKFKIKTDPDSDKKLDFPKKEEQPLAPEKKDAEPAKV